MEQTFLYEVRPQRPIVGLSGVQNVRHPKSLYLTKEDVKICLQNGSVYRRFANLDKMERVTINNIDRLHRDTFISEEDYKGEEIKEDSKDAQTVTINETPVVEEVAAPVEAPAEEEVVAAVVAAEETTDPVNTNETTEVEENSSDDSEDESDEEEEDTIEESSNNGNNSQVPFNNNRHKKKHR